MDLDTLTAWHVESYKRKRASNPKRRSAPRKIEPGEAAPTVGPATINREVALLKHFVGLAAAGALEGVAIGRDAAESVRRVKLLREPAERVRSLSPVEERRLLAALTPGVRAIVLVAAATGMRRAEVVRLRRQQVNLHAGEIALSVTKANRPRRIPINADLRAVLERALHASDCEWVFPSSRRDKNGARLPYTLDAVTRAFHRATVNAGIADLRLHDIRHHYATRLRRGGVGLDVIRDLLGHAEISTTARYAHVDGGMLRAAVANLPPMAAPTAEEIAALAPRVGGKRKRKSRPIPGQLPGKRSGAGEKG